MPALFPLHSAATVDFVLRGRWAAPDLSVDDTHDFNGGYKLPFLSPLMLRLISFAGFLLSVFAFRVQVVVLFIVFCSSWMFTMYITNFELWPSAMGSQFNVSHSKSWVQRNLWPSIIVWRWAFVTECLCQVVLRHLDARVYYYGFRFLASLFHGSFLATFCLYQCFQVICVGKFSSKWGVICDVRTGLSVCLVTKCCCICLISVIKCCCDCVVMWSTLSSLYCFAD